MKNFIIGFMLGSWLGPVLSEIGTRVAVKFHEGLKGEA